MSSHTSIYDDGWIKIYKGEGADRQQIIKIEEANDTDLIRTTPYASNASDKDCTDREYQQASDP